MQSLSWRDGVPISAQFDDPYFSLEDGLAETRFVFLHGNDLPARFKPGFTLAELGFGTGLTMLAAWEAWRQSGISGSLRFVSFEAFPLGAEAMAQALQPFDELSDLVDLAVPAWQAAEGQAVRRLSLPGLDAEIVIGDARQTLPGWSGQADAWCLDGFAPARNPELWEPELLAALAVKSSPGATAATYSAAGSVRRALASAGFLVRRCPGFGRKRHMTRAVLAADREAGLVSGG